MINDPNSGGEPPASEVPRYQPQYYDTQRDAPNLVPGQAAAPGPADQPGPAFYILLLATVVMVTAIIGIALKRVIGTPSLGVAPTFTVLGANGSPVSLSQYKGSVVVLDFWSTWCGPCQRSMPGTNELAKEYRNKRVVVLAINSWDHVDQFNAWLWRHREYNSIRFAIDTSEGGSAVGDLYHVTGIPTQVVIDRQGRIVTESVGETDESDVRQAIDDALRS